MVGIAFLSPFCLLGMLHTSQRLGVLGSAAVPECRSCHDRTQNRSVSRSQTGCLAPVPSEEPLGLRACLETRRVGRMGLVFLIERLYPACREPEEISANSRDFTGQ